MVDNGAGPNFTKEEARAIWFDAGQCLDLECDCIGCFGETACEWRYDLYNQNGDCLGVK